MEGGAVLLTIMILHPVIILFRYESNKREFKLKVALEDSNELLKRSKDISDERNRELLVAREDLNEANTELKAVNQNLESLVTARTQTLEETNLKLHKALHELDRFLYSSYHDIKGPLARMRGLANLLNSAMNSAEQMSEFNQYFSRTISEMETLIDKLNRVNSLNQQNLDLNEISVTDFLEKVKVQYPEALFTFESETTFSFVSDAGLLNQIFDCLLDNSIKYRNSSDLLHISIKANQHLFGTEFEVTDNGDGIAADQLEKVFLMFYRANAKSNGHGLGLYLAKKALEKLNGSIKVESVEGKYCKFTFYLPNIQ